MSNTIRVYRTADLEAIVALINAADVINGTEDGTSVEEKREFLSMPALVPEENAFVFEDGDGRIVSYGFVQLLKGEMNRFRTWFQVHPAFRGRGIEEQMLAHLYWRAQQRLDEVESGPVDFFTHANEAERERMKYIERFGMRETRRFWLMIRSDLADVAGAQSPEGFVTRRYRIPEDNVRVHEADNEAFRDHWGHHDQPFAMWEHYVAQPIFKPELSIVAENAATGEIAGYCMIIVNEEENNRLGFKRGWIDILGVRRAFRQRGLGTSLLLQGLANLRDAQVAQAALGADAENITGATRIYERVGFRVHKTRIAFSKRMQE